MAKIVITFFFVLSCVHLMNAVPAGFVLPTLSQIRDTVRTTGGNILGKINETVQTNYEVTRASADQVLTAATSAVAAISEARLTARDGVIAKVVELQKNLVEIANILRTNFAQNATAAQQNAAAIASTIIGSSGDILSKIRVFIANARKETATAVQTVITTEIDATSKLVNATRDLLQERISAIDFTKIQSDVANSVLQSISKIIDVTAPVVTGHIQLANELVTYVQGTIDSIAQRGSTNVAAVQANLQNLRNYLQQLAKADADGSNVVAQDAIPKVNELLNATIASLQKA